MVRFVNEEHKICARCKPPIIKMEQLPHLKNVFICPNCSSFEYIMPGRRNVQTDDQTLYQEENSGE